MKKIYIFLLLNVLVVSAFSQGVNYQYGQFRLGINTGTTFQSADIRTQLGLGWGLLAEYDFMKSKYSAIGFSLRGRYLRANMYGNHAKYFTDYPLSNDAINGSANDTINYTGKPLFLNNKTRAWEYSLEAQFHTHSLYQNYGIGFHLFIGAGLTDFEVYTNQLDENNAMYDYSQIDYSLSEKQRIKDLRQLRDYSYETRVTNNNLPSLVFTPTIGAGVQFRLSPYWSLMLEHKISLPQTDLFDGQTYQPDKDPAFVQDVYHYSSFGLIWYIGTRSDEQIINQETGYTQSTGNTTTQNTQQTTTTTYTQTTPKPQIIIVKQEVTPLPQGCASVIEAQIKNIDRQSAIKFYHNNVLVPENQYSFTLPDKFIAHIQLSEGNNIFKITATNTQNISVEKVFNLMCNNPDITICHKNPDGTKQTLTIKQSEWAAHQAHGDSQGNCPAEQPQQITVCHLGKTIVIDASNWLIHQSHGDTKGACVEKTIEICHQGQTIAVKESELAAHLAHGDKQGKCPQTQMITICHIPPTGNKRITMQIPENEWYLHQAHGDSKGACPAIEPTMQICHKDPTTQQTSTIVIPAFRWQEHQAHGDNPNTCPVKYIKICHTNKIKNQVETIMIPETQWPAHQAHGDYKGTCINNNPQPLPQKQITICHTDRETGKKTTITINAKDWAAHQAHGDSKGSCPRTTPTPKKITICHYNKEKDQLEQLQISPSEWPVHQAHGDVKGSCSQVDQTPIKICHVVNSKVKVTKVIPAYQWPYHQAHGDVQGECQNDPVIIICHKNSNGTQQTMNIHQSEWATHQAHGDTQGACSTGSGSGGIGGNTMTICHTDPQTGQKSTLHINIQDWFTHQAHGDTQGACPNNNKQTKQVKIKKQSISKP